MANFEAERVIEARQIHVRLNEIEQTIYTQRQPIGAMQACVTGPGKGPDEAPKSGWKPFKVFERWGGFDQTTWFKIKVTIPKVMKGQEVVALVRPGGESLTYVNGAPFQGLDNNRDELFLTAKAKGGETFELLLESVPSVRFDEYHHFEHADIAVVNRPVWDFWWDCTVVLEVLKTLEEDTAPRRQMLEVLNRAVKMVDLQHVDQPAYGESMAKARRFLKKELARFESAPGTGRLTLCGQSHIDTAWLWPLRETKRKCSRTFSTVLNLLDRHPDFLYLCSQPVQFEWMKEHYPSIYRRIKRYVKEGRWEPFGAAWIEMDCNVPSGEALVRQLLYGNRFYRKEFGLHSRCAWLPDAFGYNWALPQIFKKAQVDTFITTKISWSEYTEFPYGLFQWEGADGTRVLGMMPPLNYNGDPRPADCIKQWEEFQQKERVEEVPFAIGYGDGGGGPTMAMIEHGRRLTNIHGVPKCEFGRFQESVDRVASQADFEDLPVWNGELYLELHRGCQTTQADTKRNNRKSECMLHDAEFLSSLALINGGKYDQKALYEAWKTVMTNQFHDILPGSSITEVYTQTAIDYAEAQAIIRGACEKAVAHLLRKIDTGGDGTPVIVFNSLSWVRDDVVKANVKLPKGRFSVLDPSGNPVPCQKIGKDTVLFETNGVPPLGYAVYRVVSGAQAIDAGMLKASPKGMENDSLRIKFDKNGCLTSVFDKVERREVLPKGQRANVLQLFDDRPRANDAWDIDFNFEEHMWEPEAAESIEVVESSPVRAVVRIVRKTEKSTITQDVTLYANSPRIDFVTTVDWWEKRTLLKAAFPVDVRASRATYEIQFATIERATHSNTDFDQARFEVPAQRWADLSEGDYGVSLLNDCKYGYDVKENVLRLSLLRSPVEPDTTADEGRHEMTYSLYPHAWGWRNGTVHQAAELNYPMMAVAAIGSSGDLPAVSAFADVDADNVVIDTVKRHEDSNALIVRLYEAFGQRGKATVTFGRDVESIRECDLMEENDTPVKLKGNSVTLYMTPYEIRTLKVTLK